MDRRQEERTGRIRAEVKLRTVSKELEQLRLKDERNDDNIAMTKDNSSTSLHRMVLGCIGTVESPYIKRMGTPRQPQLAPSSRGLIQFSCQAAALDGIDDYSHIWIIFAFHANTNNQSDGENNKTKIRPPRAGGRKVGQLATRSPHRPNCLGLSLVRLERWDSSKRQLQITGLDLVHGTPVFDVKPCVPWDVPNFYQNKTISSALLGGDNGTISTFRVPDWVQQSDVFSQVSFTPTALEGLRTVVGQGRLDPFYTLHNNGEKMARKALEEILSQDPRSSHRGLKTNARGTTATDAAEHYNLTFGHCQVVFVVRTTTEVEVVDVVPFETDSLDHADGIPLVSSRVYDWRDTEGNQARQELMRTGTSTC